LAVQAWSERGFRMRRTVWPRSGRCRRASGAPMGSPAATRATWWPPRSPGGP